jgi:glycosyltransferase involved in cell wall biosynthesis
VTRVDLVDPPAFSPPYDHELAAALTRAGASVRLVTSHFDYGESPAAEGYTRVEYFYRGTRGAAGTRVRSATRLASHARDMLGYRRLARAADVVHFQWLPLPALDLRLLPRDRPTVLTVHDPLQRHRLPGRLAVHRGLLERLSALVVHTEYGRAALVDEYGLAPERVHVIRHGALSALLPLAGEAPLPPELPDPGRPVVLCFGLIRPYKGIERLLEAWRGIDDAELWIVGRALIDLEPLRGLAGPNVRFLARFVSSAEEAALMRRADLVVLPYERSDRFGFSGVLATALAFGKPIVLSDIGGFAEVAELGAARSVPAGDAGALHTALLTLLSDEPARRALAAAARATAAGPFSWDAAARATLALYAALG